MSVSAGSADWRRRVVVPGNISHCNMHGVVVFPSVARTIELDTVVAQHSWARLDTLGVHTQGQRTHPAAAAAAGSTAAVATQHRQRHSDDRGIALQPPAGYPVLLQQQNLQQRLPASSAGAPADSQLTALITSTSGWRELADLIGQHHASLNTIHVAAALNRLAKLAQQQQQRGQQHPGQQRLSSRSQFDEVHVFAARSLLPLLLFHAPAMSARGLANATWALAKLGVVPQRQAMQQLLACVEAAVPQMEPQHISSLLYALAQWQQQHREQQQGQGQWPATHQPWQMTWQQQQQGWQQQPGRIGSSLGSWSNGMYQQQGLNSTTTTTTAAATRRALGIPQSLLDSLLAAVAANMPAFGPHALSNSIYAAAVMELSMQQHWLNVFWQATSSSIAKAEPQHLSNMAWAAARLQLQPPSSWVAAWLAASAASMAAAVPQGLSNSIWAVARLGWGAAVLAPLPELLCDGGSSDVGSGSSSSSGGNSSWLGVFLAVSMGQLEAFSDQALTNCCWALGSITQQLQQQQQQQPGPTQLHQLLQYSQWHERLLAVLQPRLLGFTPQQLANTLWGLATAGIHPPQSWLGGYTRASGGRLLGFKPQEASQTLLALARLRHHPGRAWLALYEAAVGQQLGSCSSQVISNSVWAMTALQHTPGEQWLQAKLLPEVCRRLQMQMQTPAASARADSSVLSTNSDVAFTPQGLSVLLLCLARLSAARGGGAAALAAAAGAGGGTSGNNGGASDSPLLLPGDFWRLAVRQLLGLEHHQQQQQQHQLGLPSSSPSLTPSSSSGDSSRLSGFSPQGLSLLAGAVVLSGVEQQTAEPLVAAVMQQLAQRQQQQQQVKLADAGMVLWAAARLQLQPPADQVEALAAAALQDLQQGLSGNGSSSSNMPPSSVAPTRLAAVQSSNTSSSHSTNSMVSSPSSSNLGEGLKFLGAVMYALAVLGFYPGSAWLGVWFQLTGPLLGQCSGWTLALLLWGAVWLEQVPPAGWIQQWRHAWRQQQQQGEQQPSQQRVKPEAAQQQGVQQQQQQQAAGVAQQVAAAAAWQAMRLPGVAGAAQRRGARSREAEPGGAGAVRQDADRQALHRLCRELLARHRRLLSGGRQ